MKQRFRSYSGNPGNPIILERAEKRGAVTRDVDDGGCEQSNDDHCHSPHGDEEVVQSDEVTPASDEYGPYQANLFVFHLPTSMDNFTFYSLFRNFGTVLSARIMVNYKTGLSRGFGFISMSTAEEAKAAIEGMNGFVVGRKRLKVQLKRSNTSMSAFYAASGVSKSSLLSEIAEKVSERREREVEDSESGVTTRASSPVGGRFIETDTFTASEPLNNDP
jgi:RNA recognition motif-containing protein